MNFLKSFFSRIIKDFQHKELLPLKLLFFVHASTLFVLYPYLTIHMRELGINVEETAIMSAVTPILVIIMPPLAGMVADRIGNFRILLSICSALGGAAALLLLLVPVGRITIKYPDRVIMDMGCFGNSHGLDVALAGQQHCKLLPNLHESFLETRLESCGFLCSSTEHLLPAEFPRIVEAHSYDVVVADSGNVTDTYTYTLSPEDMPSVPSEIVDDARNHRVKKNNEHYTTSIRNLTRTSFFFPTTGLYNLTCDPVLSANDGVGATYSCKFGTSNSVEHGLSTITALKKPFLTSLRLLPDVIKPRFVVQTLSRWSRNITDNVTRGATCTDNYAQLGETVTVTVPLHNARETDGVVQLPACKPRCIVTLPRKAVCSNLETEVELDIRLTFWVYMVIRVFIGMIGGTAFAMFEGAVIAILREHNADYGLQRIYATIGGMISSPLSGMLIDYASAGKGYTDFRPAFYLYAALKIASGMLMLTMNLDFKAPSTNVVADVASVLKNIEIVALFIAIFVLGSAWGYIESFLFWLLQDLGASRSLMGITITVGGIAGIPLLVLSGPIIDRIGHANVLFIGFIFYAIRLLGYSLIYNPWLCLIFEAMESVTSSLSFTAAVTYAAKLSSTTTDSSIQGLLGGLYFGVGKGAGSLVGGYLMKGYGTRVTYRIFAVMCTITGIIYFLFNKFYLQRRPQVEGNDIVKKKKPAVQPADNVEINLDNVVTTEKEKEIKKLANNNGTLYNDVEKLPFNKATAKNYTTESKQDDHNKMALANNVQNSAVLQNNHTQPEDNDKIEIDESQNRTRDEERERKISSVNLGYVSSEDDHYETIEDDHLEEQDDDLALQEGKDKQQEKQTSDNPTREGTPDKEVNKQIENRTKDSETQKAECEKDNTN